MIIWLQINTHFRFVKTRTEAVCLAEHVEEREIKQGTKKPIRYTTIGFLITRF